jgi:hypothetical protein
MFTYRSPTGEVIATGPLSLLDEAVRARRTAEGAIAASAKAGGQMARIQARSDAIDRKERELEQREDACRAMQADSIRRFCDSVLELKHRVDAFERRKVADALRDLPDRDHPQGLSQSQQDDLEAVIEPSAERHREREQELAEAEEAIRSERDDAGQGDLPNELEAGAPAPPGIYFDPDPGRPREGTEPRIPAAVSLNAADDALDRSQFLSRAAWKAAKRQHRANLGVSR